ncbi:hypothetical protein [Castellaniella sp.]|uniref:hypothetical protein n=1 Tax=Castellaniella sp. TaxID=1955812 RepID=UPI003C77D63A
MTCEVHETYKCARCGAPFVALVADRKRDWTRFCSKACKARRQEQRTGQYSAHLRRQDGDEEPTFATAHLFSNEE